MFTRLPLRAPYGRSRRPPSTGGIHVDPRSPRHLQPPEFAEDLADPAALPDGRAARQRRPTLLRGARQRRPDPVHPRRWRHSARMGRRDRQARSTRTRDRLRSTRVRSQRAPQPYERTSVAEHADDAAALLDALAATPAIVDRAQLRRYGRDRPGAPLPRAAFERWCCSSPTRRASSRPRSRPGWMHSRAASVASRLGDGVDAVAEALICAVADEDAWRSLPDCDPADADRERCSDPRGAQRRMVARSRRRRARQRSSSRALLVAAADSPPEFREPIEVLAEALPEGRSALVGGGHLIDPAAPEVIAFVEAELGIR